MSNVTWDELAGKYANAAVRAEVRYREFKQLHTAYSEAYADQVRDADGVAKIDAASRAGNDPRRVKAGTDAAWARDEAQMYATLAAMASARHAAGKGGPL